MLKRIGLGAIGLAVLAGVLWVLFRGPIVTTLARNVIRNRMEADAVASLREARPDAIHVILCGTGAPLPDPDRAGPCTAIVTQDTFLVVDTGSGAARKLLWMGARVGGIDAVLFTHFHSDHIDGLGEMLLQRWAGGARREPLPVHGPAGVERVVAGFNEAYAADAKYRVAHHGPDIVPPAGAGGIARPFDEPPPGQEVVVLEKNGLRVIGFTVDHDPVDPAVGYRFEYAGRTVVLSGDTAKSENVTHFANGADLLVHEGLAPHLVALMTEAAEATGRSNVETISRDILTYHTSPVEAAGVAREAGVRMLIFSHLVPPLPAAPMETLFLKGVDDVFDGPVVVGRDGMTFTLPADTVTIGRDSLL